ncbi:MAG TPA: metallophosphoesterase [Kofleriaceae bacterium]|nr:metallophosphoesterase [Kofleriaceae bacterium]
MDAGSIRVDLFVAAVAAVYLGALAFGIHALGHRAIGRGLRWARRVVLSLAALGVGCFVYGWRIEPYRLEVTHTQVATAKLARSIRIVQISDVHSDPEPRLEDRLPAVIAGEHPDVIVFTGDAINAPGGLDNFRTLMTRLAQIAPTYAVRGNWDVWYWSRIDLFGGTGVVELTGAAVRAPLAGAELWIAGVPFGDERTLPRVLAAVPASALSLLLLHTPDEIERVSALGVDVYLAGHTHGGQIALPWYGALVTYSRFDKRFEAGRYQVGATALYVSRGIGMEGGRAPRIRFCARPEVSVVDLVPR